MKLRVQLRGIQDIVDGDTRVRRALSPERRQTKVSVTQLTETQQSELKTRKPSIDGIKVGVYDKTMNYVLASSLPYAREWKICCDKKSTKKRGSLQKQRQLKLFLEPKHCPSKKHLKNRKVS